jgi:hypothetical protein
MDFVHRHERRLKQHVERGTAKGIPNFFHILLTVGNLLLSQITRIIAAFESDAQIELTSDQWHQIRDRLDSYYQTLGRLLEMTAFDYLDAVLPTKRDNEARELFSENIADLTKLYNAAIDCRDKIKDLQQARLIVVTCGRGIPGPGFFSSLLAPSKWPAFQVRIRQIQRKLTDRLDPEATKSIAQ